MSNSNVTIFFTLLLLVACLSISASPSPDNVHEACSVTRYRKICVRSLSPFSTRANKSPGKWARAGVSVALREAKSVARYLAFVKKSDGHMRLREREALSDCIELFGDAIDELHKSLGVLRKLSTRNFGEQMGDLVTWLSASLTDQDTCLDGFSKRTREKQVGSIRTRVLRGTYFSSNALALANKLATTG